MKDTSELITYKVSRDFCMCLFIIQADLFGELYVKSAFLQWKYKSGLEYFTSL